MRLRKRQLAGCAVAVVALLISVWALGGAPRTVGAQVDLVELYQQYIDASNAGDLDAAIAFWTEDAVFEGTPGCPPGNPCVGREAIRAEFERIGAGNLQLTIISAEVTDNTVTAQWEFTSDCTRAAGIETLPGSETVQFVDDKISSSVVVGDVTGIPTQQFADFAVCAQALEQPAGAPAAGTGGLLNREGSGVATWGYALLVGGIVLIVVGLATLRRARGRR